MVWNVVVSAGSPESDHSCFRESAALLNESIILEIITGKYLEPSIGQSNKWRKARGGTHTTFPLVLQTKFTMRAIVHGAGGR